MTLEVRSNAIQRFIAEPTLTNRNALVDVHQYLCRRGARKFYRGTVERCDLEQIAAIGLIKACERFSSCYDTPFEAYAWLMIVGELMHFVRDHERAVRLPRGLRSLDNRYVEVFESLMTRLEREPSVREVAVELGISPMLVDELRAARGSAMPISLELSAGSAIDAWTAVGLEPNARYDVEDRVALSIALRDLSDRQLTVLRGIYVEELTQEQVGRRVGCSQRQVSRILQGALERLARLIAA